MAAGGHPDLGSCTCCTNSFRSACRRDWAAIAKDLRPISTAATKAATHDRLAEFTNALGRGRRRWSNRWKAALNAFDSTFDGRLSKERK